MSTKTNSEKLSAFKKANKERRKKIAAAAGFSTIEDYLQSLTGVKVPVKKVSRIAKVVKKISDTFSSKDETVTVHVVDVLDKSGSMSGGKIKSALEAINAGIKDLQENTENNYTYSLCTFSNDYRENNGIEMNFLKVKPSAVQGVTAIANGGTALYDAIGHTLTTLSKDLGKNDKVLVNIYTDGEENASRKYTARSIAELIKKKEDEGFTITFIGTDRDVNFVVNALNIDVSNTLKYDGSASGLRKSMSETLKSRATYFSKVANNEEVKTGFYKTIN